MNVLTHFTFLLLTILVCFVSSIPVDEDYSCSYDHCLEDDFFCATDGSEYQYFKNTCYMDTFNSCNRQNKPRKFNWISNRMVITIKVFLTDFKPVSSPTESTNCIDEAEDQV